MTTAAFTTGGAFVLLADAPIGQVAPVGMVESPGKARVLVVDDQREFAYLLFRLLERLGFEPVIAFDPSDALELVDHSVAAVITDIEMPGMNGVELVERIRQRHRGMPVAFCTGSPTESDLVRKAASLGPVHSKVSSLAQLRELLGRLLVVVEPTKRRPDPLTPPSS